MARVKKRIERASTKSAPSSGDGRPRLHAAGRQTLAEILSQPATWRETARQFEENAALVAAFRNFSSREPWLFVACGSSYYLSETIAAQWTKLLGVRCTAAPASEMLFAREDVLRRAGANQVVFVSRSGETTEVLRAAELFRKRADFRTLGVTCSETSVLRELCTDTLQLPWADEKSMVMTRSFTSILVLFERMGARFAGDNGLISALDCLPEKTTHWLAVNADKIRALVAKRGFEDFVFLGQSAHYWLAQEAALKMTEMSSSYAQAYHTLEFRHGPKSISSGKTLITFLLSDIAAEEEIVLAAELKKLGAATMIVLNRATGALGREHDLAVELGMDEPEFARMAMTAIPAQLLGLAVGLGLGLDPDEPKNLTRAVVLDRNKDAPAKRRSA